MNKNMLIPLALILVCASVTWSVKSVEDSLVECVRAYRKCRVYQATSKIQSRLCAFKFAKCSAPLYMKQAGLTGSLNDFIKSAYFMLLKKEKIF
ncbi:hypothetical protein ScPMuIL_018101 [Solemya velum]